MPSRTAVLCLLALACLGPGRPAAAQTAARAAGYRIGAKDLVQIQVYEVPELNVERRVGENGAINLPQLGDVGAAGLTGEELEERLRELLSRYVQRATVNVEVLDFRSKPITVIGAVRQPGALAFSGRWTLLEAITAAGGLAEGHGGSIYVLRRADNGLSDQVVVSAEDLLVRADPKVNLPIVANDLINVPATVEVTVYCLGEVATPGAVVFKSTERVTLLAAIARAGGLSERAASRIFIRRSTQGAAGGELAVDFKRILAGKEPDPELRGGDVVVVKESFF
ncbi:MAG TPA: polysaccharide biosynthesis/export family protein [Thermoanaerobaculia bacterium]|nr:polysaccharide biosynthesis/export family protein [Thermoanaerobaculia bacterium]